MSTAFIERETVHGFTCSSPYVISTSISAFTIQAGKYAAENRTGCKELKEGKRAAKKVDRKPNSLQRSDAVLAIAFFASSGVTLKGNALAGVMGQTLH